jgi:hypothetical protein
MHIADRCAPRKTPNGEKNLILQCTPNIYKPEAMFGGPCVLVETPSQSRTGTERHVPR